MLVVGAERFELSTPSPPDWCANQAAPRSEPLRAEALLRPIPSREADYSRADRGPQRIPNAPQSPARITRSALDEAPATRSRACARDSRRSSRAMALLN